MQIQDFLDSVLSQRMYQRDGQRAPYKPLTVLYALGTAARGIRLTRYSQAEPDLMALLVRFGPTRATPKPEQPAWRLRQPTAAVQIWEVDGASRVRVYDNGDPNVADLREYASIGLSESAFRLFDSRAADARYAAGLVADELLPDTIREELLEEVGLGESGGAALVPLSQELELTLSSRERVLAERSRRSAAFSRRVLSAYAHRCAICSVAPKLDDRPFGLEAAHIRWVQAGGPDEIHNGLCLCRMHHIALDRGALTLDHDLRIEISPRLVLDEATRRIFEPFGGRRASMPSGEGHAPHPEALAWHRTQVFKS